MKNFKEFLTEQENNKHLSEILTEENKRQGVLALVFTQVYKNLSKQDHDKISELILKGDNTSLSAAEKEMQKYLKESVQLAEAVTDLPGFNIFKPLKDYEIQYLMQKSKDLEHYVLKKMVKKVKGQKIVDTNIEVEIELKDGTTITMGLRPVNVAVYLKK